MDRSDRRLLQEAEWLPRPIDPGSSFSFFHLKSRHFPFPFHYHPEMELTYVARGEGRRVVGEVVQPFRAGDLVLLGSMLPHVWISDPACPATEAFVLRFDERILEGRLLHLVECAGVEAWLARARRGLSCPAMAPSVLEGFLRVQSARSAASRLVGFLDLLLGLSQNFPWEEICADSQTGVAGGCTEQRIGFALRYLRRHFCTAISQADLARRVGMKPSAFSRLFHRATGQTFQEMLLGLRLQHARRLLAATRLSVAEACFASGFHNLSNFNKQFRALYGQTPRACRLTTPSP